MARAAPAPIGRRQRIAQRRKALELEAEQQRTAFLSRVKSWNAGRVLAVAAGVGSIALGMLAAPGLKRRPGLTRAIALSLWSRIHR